jgi:ribosomal protein S18 acetylase RimI-like enzyme
MLEFNDASADQRAALHPALVDRRTLLNSADPSLGRTDARRSAEDEVGGILEKFDEARDTLLVFSRRDRTQPLGHAWWRTGVGNYPEEGLAVLRDLEVESEHFTEATSKVLGRLEAAGTRLVVTRARADDSASLCGFETAGFRRISMVMYRDLARPLSLDMSCPAVSLRTMTAAEATSYWTQFTREYTDVLIDEMRTPEFAHREAHWLADLSQQEEGLPLAIVDEESGESVGALWYFVSDSGVGSISDIRLQETCRGRGFGTATFQCLEARALEAGTRFLVLGVACSNQPALRLYRKVGFEATSIELRRRIGPS